MISFSLFCPHGNRRASFLVLLGVSLVALVARADEPAAPGANPPATPANASTNSAPSPAVAPAPPSASASTPAVATSAPADASNDAPRFLMPAPDPVRMNGTDASPPAPDSVSNSSSSSPTDPASVVPPLSVAANDSAATSALASTPKPAMSASQPDSAQSDSQTPPYSDLTTPPDLSTLPKADAGSSAPPPASAAANGPSPDMLNLLDLLVQKNVITKDDATQLQKKAHDRSLAQAAQAQAQAATVVSNNPDKVHVVYVPASVRAQIRDEIKDDVMQQARDENWADPRALPNWLTRISFFGDVRARYEGDMFPTNNATGSSSLFWNMNGINTGTPFDVSTFGNPAVAGPPLYNNDQDRNRERLRVRFGLSADLGSGFVAGIRLASGQDDSPVSENQSLGYANNGQGGNFSRYAIWLDRGFIGYDWGGRPDRDLSLTIGRFDNPFFGTTMLWANDLAFDGLVAKGKYEITDGVTPFLTVGGFPVYNTDFNFASDNPNKFSSEDKYLVAVQGGTDWKINDDFHLKAGAALYDLRISRARFPILSSPSIPPTRATPTIAAWFRPTWQYLYRPAEYPVSRR